MHFLLMLTGLFGQFRKSAWFVADSLAGIAIAAATVSWPIRLAVVLAWGVACSFPHYLFLFGHFIEYTEGQARQVAINVTRIPLAKRRNDLLIKFGRCVGLTGIVMVVSALILRGLP